MADVTEFLKLLTAFVMLLTALAGLSKTRRQVPRRQKKSRRR